MTELELLLNDIDKSQNNQWGFGQVKLLLIRQATETESL